jgi:hypothetical protein
MIASPQPNPRDDFWGISDEWGKFCQLSLVESQPRWSDWHWNADSRLVRVSLDKIQQEEECCDAAVLEQKLQILQGLRQELLDFAGKSKSKFRVQELMRGVKGKDRQIAWVEEKLRVLGSDRNQSRDKDGDLVNPDTIKSPTKNDTCSKLNKSPTNFRRKNTPPSESSKFPTKGRGKNKLPASGHISPTVQRKDGKEYPRVQGERVSRDLAWDYPEQFVWLYNWCVQDGDGCWKNRSKRVPVGRIYSVRSAVSRSKCLRQRS